MKRILAILMLSLIGTLFASNIATLLAFEESKPKEMPLAIPAEPAKRHDKSPKIEKPKKNNAILASNADFRPDTSSLHRATWYRTDRHSKVHREHPTAAYNFAPKGTFLLITNPANGKSCVVEVTDRMGKNTPKKIDLSHKAFGLLETHSRGFVNVTIRPIEGNETNNQI